MNQFGKPWARTGLAAKVRRMAVGDRILCLTRGQCDHARTSGINNGRPVPTYLRQQAEPAGGWWMIRIGIAEAKKRGSKSERTTYRTRDGYVWPVPVEPSWWVDATSDGPAP